MVIAVPMSSISRTQVLLDILHGCGGFVGAVLGLVLRTYWSDSHSSTIPLARSPLDILFDWSILMPVAWYVALANSLLPLWMRNMKASRRVCIHPHSVVVSSLRSLGGDLLLVVGLNSCRVLRSP